MYISKMYRRLTMWLALGGCLVAFLAAIPASAQASGIKYAMIHGKKYALWECTLIGTVVAGGITFVGGGAPVWAIAGILGGGSFTAGCEAGAPSRGVYMDYIKPSNGCWMVFPHGSIRRRFQECVA